MGEYSNIQQKYARFVEDKLCVTVPVSIRDVYHWGSEHELVGYIIAREIDYGNTELSNFLGVDNVRDYRAEGEKWQMGEVEDWVIEGENSVSVGQSVSCNHKPCEYGVPKDVRQAYWFHETFQVYSNKDVNPPYIIAVNQPPSEVKTESELLDFAGQEDEIQVILRRLDSEKGKEVIKRGFQSSETLFAD